MSAFNIAFYPSLTKFYFYCKFDERIRPLLNDIFKLDLAEGEAHTEEGKAHTEEASDE